DMAGQDDGRGRGLIDFDVAGAFDVKDAAIGGNGQFDGISGRVVEDDLLIIGIDGRAGVSRFNARRKLTAAEQMGPKERLVVALYGMTSTSIPGTAAVIKMAPGSRMIVAKSAAGISALVEGGKDMHICPGINVEIVPFICAHPTLG